MKAGIASGLRSNKWATRLTLSATFSGAIILRDAKNFIHRITGYIPHVLHKSEGQGQDASLIAMVLDYSQKRGIDQHLAGWIERANTQF